MQHVERIKRRFMAVNHERLRRLRNDLRPRQRIFLDLLPLLFHVNDADLPGYVSDDTPAGISDYRPAKQSIEAACQLYKKYNYRFRALPRYPLYAVFLLGSSGTIAYSRKSDFDVWLVHKPDLENEAYNELREKCRLLEEWSAELDLEVHFYLIDEIRFRNKQHGDLSTENSGSTQHHLLLDEFYRTGLYIAGRYPAWWVIPPEQEHDYQKYLQELYNSKTISEFDVVDFGSYTALSADEFVGASVWQIYKGIESPYKSLLKLLLMESYASEYPDIDFLATRFKKAIYDGESSLQKLDPYIMMTNKVEEYLVQRGEEKRLELARRCFYFKVNQHLSENTHSDLWQHDAMWDLVNDWGWETSHLMLLDSRPAWKINRVLEERKLLVSELKRSYRLLSGFVRQHTNMTAVNERDLTILGRKLHTAFERKAGKIDIVNPNISDNLYEQYLSIHHRRSPDNKEYWLLYRGKVTADEARRTTPIRRSSSLVDIIAWCEFNHIIGPSTVSTLYSSNNILSNKDLKKIIHSFRQAFPKNTLAYTDLNKLSRPPYPGLLTLFINIGIDPLASYTQAGKNIISEKNDALSYGNFSQNLVKSIDMVSVTSWNEIYVSNSIGAHCVLHTLCMILNQRHSASELPQIQVFCLSLVNGHIITERLNKLFSNVFRAFSTNNDPQRIRYVLNYERSYVILQYNGNKPAYSVYSDRIELLEGLTQESGTFMRTVFDEYAMPGDVVPEIINQNKANTVQVYYLLDNEQVDIYITDESGSLFYLQQHFYTEKSLINQYQHFFNAILERVIPGENPDDPIHTMFYRLSRSEGHWMYHLYQENPEQTSDNYISVQVIINNPDGVDESINVFCDDREFSGIEMGDNLYPAVAEYVMSQRTSDSSYPVYITDIDISCNTAIGPSGSGFTTATYLKYKKIIEQRLNAEINKLSGEQLQSFK